MSSFEANSSHMYLDSCLQFSFIRESPSIPKSSFVLSQPVLKPPSPRLVEASSRRKRSRTEKREDWKKRVLAQKQDIHTYIKLLSHSPEPQLVQCILFDDVLENVSSSSSSLIETLAKLLIQRSALKSQSPRSFRSVMTSLSWTGKTPFLSALEMAMSREYYTLRDNMKK